MELLRIKQAILEAQRFLAKAEDVLALNHHDRTYADSSKYTGSLRRASMDLTRALAEMRRP